MIQENFTIDALIKNNKTIYNKSSLDKLTYTKGEHLDTFN
jgi:hypothetical protein